MGNLRKFSAAALALAAVLPAQRAFPAAQAAAQFAANIALRVMERITPEITEPPVRFRLESAAAADPFALEETEGLESVRAWQIQVFDRAGRKVSWLQGTGSPSEAAIPWAGTAPNGTPLPDGFYDARLVWLDSLGRPRASQRESISLATPLEIRALAGRKLAFSYTLEGLVITINERLIFRPGASEIQAAAIPALEDIRAFLEAHPDNKVTIRGYTDSSGAAAANLRLSRERAAKVHAYLIASGMPAARLAYFGLGRALPVASNATPEGRARNRRVDVVMLKPDSAGSLQ